jgi:DNA-directed RNA polymerase subunit H
VIILAIEKIADHFLVPKHEIVPKDKVESVLKEYGANSEQLPKISSDDPMVEEIGAVRGDVIKISRKSMTAGKAIYFRIVQ